MPRNADTVCKDWTGKVDATAEFVSEATPPARVEYLIAIDMLALSAAQAYCFPALMFDSVDTDTRRLTLITPPFALQALGFVTEWGEPAGAFQGNVEIDTTTSGSIGTSYSLTDDSDTIAIPSQALGAAAYADSSGAKVLQITQTGATINRAPPQQMNRQIDLAEALVHQVEDVEIKGAHGFGLCVTVRSVDMETVT